MNDTPNIPSAIRALSILSGVPTEEVTVQVASLLSAVGGPEAGLVILRDEILPIGFHLLHFGGDSARQRRLTQLLFQPLRFLQDVPLAYCGLAHSRLIDWMASPYLDYRCTDEFVDVDPDRVERIAEKDAYQLADAGGEVSFLTNPSTREQEGCHSNEGIGRSKWPRIEGIRSYPPTYGLLSESFPGPDGSRRPYKRLLFFDNPEIDDLMKSSESFDYDSPRMILDESGRLWDEACRSASDFEPLRRVLGERAFVNPAARGQGSNWSGCSRLFSVVTGELGRRLLAEPEMEGLVSSLLLSGPPSWEGAIGREVNSEDVSAGYRCYHDTLTGLAKLRRFDVLGLRRIIMNDVAWNEFYWGRHELMERLETFDSATRNFSAPFSNLPASILWSLARLESTRIVRREVVFAALAMAEAAMRNHLGVIRKLRRDAENLRRFSGPCSQ